MKRRLRIIQDSDAPNPREEYDGHVGRMICFHRRYKLGDEHNYDSVNCKEELACEADADLEEKLGHLRVGVCNALYECLRSDGGYSYTDAAERVNRIIDSKCEALIDRAFDAGYIALPLYLYDHSGITMNTGGFGCKWDSGCVGLIVCDRATVEKEFGGCEDAAACALRAEVEEYDHYITGNCWGFIAEEFDGDEWVEVDSCWGFLGNPEDAKDALCPDCEDCEIEIEYV